jgi:hypothetical protein
MRGQLREKSREVNGVKSYLSQLMRSIERPITISNDNSQRLLIAEIEQKVFGGIKRSLLMDNNNNNNSDNNNNKW